MLDFALLGFLNYGPQTGYELKQAMDKSTGHFWYAEQSHIYANLKRLQKRGLVKSQLEPGGGRPDRRVYHITVKGRQALAQWLAQPETALAPHKETLILKVFFAAQLDKEDLLTQLRLARELHQRQLRIYQEKIPPEIEQKLADRPQLARDALLWQATLRMGQMVEETYLRWLEETIAMVQNKL